MYLAMCVSGLDSSDTRGFNLEKNIFRVDHLDSRGLISWSCLHVYMWEEGMLNRFFFLFVWFASENGLETRNLGLVESFPCYQTAKFHFNIVDIIEITDKVPSKNYVT